MKNKIVATFLLTLLVVVGLEAMYFLPKLSLGGKPLRRVDLLSDVRPDKSNLLRWLPIRIHWYFRLRYVLHLLIHARRG